MKSIKKIINHETHYTKYDAHGDCIYSQTYRKRLLSEVAKWSFMQVVTQKQ